MSEESDKRIAARQPVLKGAKAHFGNSVVDCLILDLSEQGVRVSIDGFVAFPDALMLELRSGSRWDAVRRWQRGTEIGLEFTGFAGLGLESSAKAGEFRRQLRNSGLQQLVMQLQQERFFEYPELKMAVERLDEAAVALDKLLKTASGLQ